MTIASYDSLHYPNQAYSDCHLPNIEASATLLGMSPKPITDCRVLELGCAAGWNLLPQAVDLPNSEFIGVDLSEKQVQEGQEVIAKIEQKNIDIHCDDILNIDESWGKYDYIICHGVYSWVPQEVQDKILKICKENLNENGVALVSYNVLPGWYFNTGIREMMLYHNRKLSVPIEKLQHSMKLIELFASSTPKGIYRDSLNITLNNLRNSNDGYIYHEFLEDSNYPIYFYKFLSRLQNNRLKYLGNSMLSTMTSNGLTTKIKEAFQNLSMIEQEQYKDFLYNNKFRSTLICHEEIQLKKNSTFSDKLEGCYLMLPKPVLGEKFSDMSDKASMLLQRLNYACPESILIDDTQAAEYLFTVGVAKILCRPIEVTNKVSKKPLVTRLVRIQSSYGSTVNQRHQNFQLDNFTNLILEYLDGTNDKEALINKVYGDIEKGNLTLLEDKTEISRDVMGDLVDNALNALCKMGFFIA